MDILDWEDVPQGKYRTFGNKAIDFYGKERRMGPVRKGGVILKRIGTNNGEGKTGGVIRVPCDKVEELADKLQGGYGRTTVREAVGTVLGKVDVEKADSTADWRRNCPSKACEEIIAKSLARLKCSTSNSTFTSTKSQNS